MKELHEAKFNFQQKKFLKQIDPSLLTKAAAAIGKAKTEFSLKRDQELSQQQRTWERQAALMQEASTINLKKAEAEYKRWSASMGKREAPANWSGFAGYASGSNPRFFAPNFFNIGYGRTVGGVTGHDTWQMNFGSGLVTVPYSDPAHGLMGERMWTANPGGQNMFNTGLGNLFFSQSAQTIPVSASFIIYGGGASFGMGLGFSRAWLRLGIDLWVYGTSLPAVLRHFRFVDDVWISVPSPWVAEYRHFDYETHSTGTRTITLQPGDLVMGSAVIEQGAICGGLFTGSKSEFLVTVTPLQIGP